jgi:hypothetical protein
MSIFKDGNCPEWHRVYDPVRTVGDKTSDYFKSEGMKEKT